METVLLEALGWLCLGCFMRTFLPYITAWMEKLRDEGKWMVLPFEPKYLASFVLAVIAYGITLATVEGAAESLMALTPVAIISMGYAGGDLARRGLRVLFESVR
jgi:hypothetical protein